MGLKSLSVVLCLLGSVAMGAEFATPVINEFMASNASIAPLGAGELLDADGDSSDWIELYNPNEEPFDLSGWHLTDDPNDLARWEFPDGTTMPAKGYLLVFASGKDRTSGQLHTDFKLSAGGGYLALVMPDGRTIAHDYGDTYPPQQANVSYGLAENVAQLVDATSTISYHVPTQADAGLNWTALDFDADDWAAAQMSLGFSQTPQWVGRDIGSPMPPGGHATQDPAVMTLYGGGADIGGTADSFHFVATAVSGDGVLTARVMGVSAANAWAKAGVMVRETLTAGSKYAMEALTPSSGVVFQHRTAANATSTLDAGQGTGRTLLDSNRQERQYIYRLPFRGRRRLGPAWDAGHRHGAGRLHRFLRDLPRSGSHVRRRVRPHDIRNAGQQSPHDRDAGQEFLALDADRVRRRVRRTSSTPCCCDMRYEDGFVAWLNGAEIARDNVTGTPQWNSVAASDRAKALADPGEHI